MTLSNLRLEFQKTDQDEVDQEGELTPAGLFHFKSKFLLENKLEKSSAFCRLFYICMF